MYTVYRTKEPINIDGNLDKSVWKKAPKSARFVNMVDGDPALYDTRTALLWDDNYLYIAYWVEEPFVQATLTERDDLLYTENNVELFIDGGDTYYELEINALNTIYEAFFIWKDAYKRGGKYDIPQFDVHQDKVSTYTGHYERVEDAWEGTHPRGLRWAFRNWDFPGLKTAVQVDGEINNNDVVDNGWTVEIALPWDGMEWLANDRSLPPKENDIWRMLFARFQKIDATGDVLGWSLDPIGLYDSHRPEKYTKVMFNSDLI